MNKKKIVLSEIAIFILLMGIVSLLSDLTHEGMASLKGAYLSFLGGNAQQIGFVSGLATLVAYGLRILFGYLTDKTKKYWLFTILGYAIDLAFVPLLALIPKNGFLLAASFIVLGKVGKAMKKPAKDSMVSFAAKNNNHLGKSFAILEFVDQIGAFLGPTLLSFIMILASSLDEYHKYILCFSILAIPAIACLILLFVSKKKFPHPEEFETVKKEDDRKVNKTLFILYLVGAAIFAFGFIDFSLITLYEKDLGIIPLDYLPLLYSFAMLIDAFSALLFGFLYDKKKFFVLFVASIACASFSVFIFGNENIYLALIGIGLWGVGFGAQESVMKAAIASLTFKNKRSFSYGLFQLLFGFSWFIGSWLMGYLYNGNQLLMIVLSLLLISIASLIFLSMWIVDNKYNKIQKI